MCLVTGAVLFCINLKMLWIRGDNCSLVSRRLIQERGAFEFVRGKKNLNPMLFGT